LWLKACKKVCQPARETVLSAMPNARPFVNYWLPVLIWMTVIWSASGDSHSFQHTSRILGPAIRWLVPQISDEALDMTVTVIRKGGHLAEYAILAVLLRRALRKPLKGDPRPWSWREAGWALVLVALYAASDEFHQSFVPSREASVRDVLIDTLGGILGLISLRIAGRWGRGRVGTPP
jgi:VanZ family protein